MANMNGPVHIYSGTWDPVASSTTTKPDSGMSPPSRKPVVGIDPAQVGMERRFVELLPIYFSVL